MADAWGGSWGSAWGVSWGGESAVIAGAVLAKKKLRRRYRAELDDGTIIWGDSAQQVRELRKKYETIAQPEPVSVKPPQKLKIRHVEYEPPSVQYYAQPIQNVFTRINIKGDDAAILAKLAFELDDDEEAIQIALDLMF